MIVCIGGRQEKRGFFQNKYMYRDPCDNKNQKGVHSNWGSLHAIFGQEIAALGFEASLERGKADFSL